MACGLGSSSKVGLILACWQNETLTSSRYQLCKLVSDMLSPQLL